MEHEDGGMKPLKIYRASAGSGKTFTLAVEYISLLMMNPMEYQNILAVTFTNKATAEMKQRILSTLYGIAHGLESAEAYVEKIMENIEVMRTAPHLQGEPWVTALQRFDRDLLQQRAQEALSNIIHDYSRFHIETIDSFFQGIVRELANELELSVKMKVELDETAVLSDAIDQIIDHLKEGSNEFRTIIEFIEEKIRENRSWQIEDTVKEFGKNIFQEKYLIHGEDVRRKITDSGALYRYRTILDKELEEKKQAVIQLSDQMLAAYKDIGITEKDGTQSIVSFLGKVSTYDIKEPDNRSRGTFSDSIEAYTQEPEKWFKKSSKNKDELMPRVQSVLMPMLAELFQRHNVYVSHLHTVKAIEQHLHSLMLLNEISLTVKSLNDEAQRFLLSETANFLRNVMNNQDIPFIYEKTGSHIRHIMIDEFQDTSKLQWNNFKPLIKNSLAEGGSCLIVGDVKQSIYRFRNSDWQILNSLEGDAEFQGQMERIPASYNFRSSRHVVEFNNELFKNAVAILQQGCPALTTAYGDVAQIARKAEGAGFVRVENIDYHDIDPEQLPETWEKETDADYDMATLQRLQLAVKELTDNGVKANDITILTRTNREIPQICDYFNEHQDVVSVKVVSDDAFRLDASPAVNIIICALRVVSDPDSLLHLASLKHHTGNIPEAFDEAARNALRFKSISEQIEAIYQIFQLHRQEDQDAYLFFLGDVVEQFCQENMTDLETFLQTWDETLCEKTIPGGAADGVRIMTMHKSKGLEFHSVILPYCSWPIKPKDSEVIWCVPNSAPYDLMPLLPISVSRAKDDSIFADDRHEEELRTLVDNINVLYVAFTRAKHNLIVLTGNKLGEQPNPNVKRNEPATASTDPTAEEEDKRIDNVQSFLTLSMPSMMEKSDVEGVVTCYQYGTVVPSVLPSNKQQEEQLNCMEADYAPLPVSFTSHPTVAEFRQSYDSDMFITADSLNPKIQQHAERIRLISLGNLYHSIFEHIRTLDDVPHAIQWLASKGCFGTLLEATEAQKSVVQMIEHITPEHPEWFSAEWQALNERAILFLENQMQTSKRPDRVIVKGDKAIIIDYKTAQGVVHKKADGTLVPPAENVEQIKIYKELLAQIGYTDVQAYLWYILDHLVVEIT